MVMIEVLTHRIDGFPGMHAAGFVMYRRALLKKLGVRSTVVVYSSIGDLRSKLHASHADVVLVITDWSVKVEELSELFVHARSGARGRKLVYFDTFDATSSPYFDLVTHVDAFVKSKLLIPIERNLASFEGGYIFTDFCRRTLGWDLGEWGSASRPPPADQLGKIIPGWSYAVSRRLRMLARLNRLAGSRLQSRPIQLHARITPPPVETIREWYHEYRAFCAEAVAPLRSRWRCTPTKRISPTAYLLEMRRCKLVFSPFGWGELCLRDFEAIASGCLLVKPDMSHVKSYPDVFTPGETYVPIRWDLSDLAEVCERCLTDEKEAARMARNAQERLHTYLEHGGFVESVRSLLQAVSIEPGRAPA